VLNLIILCQTIRSISQWEHGLLIVRQQKYEEVASAIPLFFE